MLNDFLKICKKKLLIKNNLNFFFIDGSQTYVHSAYYNSDLKNTNVSFCG